MFISFLMMLYSLQRRNQYPPPIGIINVNFTGI